MKVVYGNDLPEEKLKSKKVEHKMIKNTPYNMEKVGSETRPTPQHSFVKG